MRIVLISDHSRPDGLRDYGEDRIKSAVGERQNDQLAIYPLQEKDLHHCIGCFHCWVKTPGVCVIDDLGRQICRAAIQSAVTIYLSPVKYGCYSPLIRRALDRNLPNILPFFKKINGEVHHTPRYSHYPKLIMIGYGEAVSPGEVATFQELADANALNFQVENARTYFYRDPESADAVIHSLRQFIRESEG